MKKNRDEGERGVKRTRIEDVKDNEEEKTQQKKEGMYSTSTSDIFFKRPSRCVLSNLYNIFCTVNTQHTLRQDAIITIRLYLATCFGRKRPSSGQLRTILRYSKNIFIIVKIFLLYLNIVLNWPEDGRLRPKHVATYNLIVIIASCLNVCCVLTVKNIYYTNKVISPYCPGAIVTFLFLKRMNKEDTEIQQSTCLLVFHRCEILTRHFT